MSAPVPIVNLRKHRKSIGLSQKQAAAKCSISAQSVRRIERGDLNITLLLLVRYCDGLGLKVCVGKPGVGEPFIYIMRVKEVAS